MIGVRAGVDDHADRLLCDRPDRRQEVVRHRRCAAVDEDDTVLSDVDRDIAPGAKNDEDVGPNLNGFEGRVGGGGLLLSEKAVRLLAPFKNENQRDQPGMAVPDARSDARSYRESYITIGAFEHLGGCAIFARLVL